MRKEQTAAERKQFEAVEWFCTGAAIMGFVWLCSSNWPFTVRFLTSWEFWGTVAFFGLIRAFGGSRAGKPVAGSAYEGVAGDPGRGSEVWAGPGQAIQQRIGAGGDSPRQP